MAKAYVAFGTNLGDRMENIRVALESLDRLPHTKVLAQSNIYETAPWGYAEQGNFLNGVALVETALSPAALLGGLLGIEAAMGRLRTIQNGPRVMDLDLLLYDEIKLDSAELTLPHPRMMERGFVLAPLTDLLPVEPYVSALAKQDPTQVWQYEA